MSYTQYRQGYPIVQKVGNEVENIKDTRHPFSHPRWVNTDFTKNTYYELLPDDNISTINPSQQQNFPITFSVIAQKDIEIDWTQSFFSYQIRVKLANGNVLTKSDANAGTYCSVTNLSSGASQATTTCKYIYMRNSGCPFQTFTITDLQSGKIIEEIKGGSLNSTVGTLTQIMLGSQDSNFWTTQTTDVGQTSGDANIYASNVHTFRPSQYYFTEPVSSTNIMSPTGLLPLLSGDTNGSGSSATFSEVQKQQMQLWGSSNGNNGDNSDGMEIRFFPISDFLNQRQFNFAFVNRLKLTFTVSDYGSTFTDCCSSYTAGGINAWSYSNNAMQFEIYNPKLHLKKYFVNQNIADALLTEAQKGIDISYSKVIVKPFNWQQSNTSLTLALDDSTIHNLERVVIVAKQTADAGNTSYRDGYMFRNMSTYNYGVGLGSAFLNQIAPALKTNYNGMYQIVCSYMSGNIPTEQPMYIYPWHFYQAKEFFMSCFEYDEPKHADSYLWEGIDSTGIWMNSNTQFCLALDFRNCAGAEQSGISLEKSPLTITITLNNTGTSISTSYVLEAYMFCGAKYIGSTTGVMINQ